MSSSVSTFAATRDVLRLNLVLIQDVRPCYVSQAGRSWALGSNGSSASAVHAAFPALHLCLRWLPKVHVVEDCPQAALQGFCRAFKRWDPRGGLWRPITVTM